MFSRFRAALLSRPASYPQSSHSNIRRDSASSAFTEPQQEHVLLDGNKVLIHHSDRGSQYLSIRYTERLALADIDASVGTVGDSYDNALAETINGLYKAEVIHHLGPWKSMAQVEWETLKWVDCYNNRRLLAPIGYRPPAEAERAFYADQSRLDIAA